MVVTLTIRDVPDEIRDTLARAARDRGQSLQAYLMSLLSQQAAFSRNAQVLSEIANDLATRGGAGPDAPDAATLIEQDRPASHTGKRRRRSA
jgi:antitoxin FitA